jgi:hypothetical protein
MRDWSCFGKATPVVVVLAAFQFWHWFRPSEPFLVDILNADLHVPEAVVYHDIYPWSTYALLPATLLSAALFEVFGFGSALLLAALGDVVTVFLVILSRGQLGPLWASQVTFALSFAAVFSVVATLFALLPPDLYQKASSYSRAASLVGTIASSLVGQALASLGLRWWTLWGTVAGTTVSLVVITTSLWLGVLRPFGNAADMAEPLLTKDAHDGPATGAADDAAMQRPSSIVVHAPAEEVVSGAASPDHSIRDLDRSLHAPLAAASSPQPALSHSARAPPPASGFALMSNRQTRGSVAVDTSDDVASVASSEGSSLWGIKPSEATPSRVITRLRKVLSSAWVSYSSPVVLGLSLWSAVLRAAHTLALTYWQPLLDELRTEQDGAGNGIIYAAAYICAAAATCAPALLESAAVARLLGCKRHGAAGCCGGQQCGLALLGSGSLVAAGALTMMATATTVTVAAAALIVFHSTGELLLVVAAAAIGREMVRQESWRAGNLHTAKLAGSAPIVESEPAGLRDSALYASGTAEGDGKSPLLANETRAGPGSSTEAVMKPARAAKGVYFAAVLGINALVGMVLQLIVQASVGTGPNRLGLAWQYAVFAGVVVLGMVLGVMIPALTACFGAGRPKPDALR